MADPKEKELNICFVAAEVAPFAKTGGLADVSAALPAHLKKAGHDVRIFMPLYSKIRFEAEPPVPVDFLHHVPLKLGSQTYHFTVFTTRLPGTEVDVYFIGCPPLYDREGIYTGDWDDHLRFAFLSQAALKCCQHMGWAPDVVHANDWHTALVPLYLRTLFGWDEKIFGGTRSVLTIHNIAYQGRFGSDIVDNLGLSAYSRLLHQDHLSSGYVSFLETGILHADVVTTVSETYAREIQTAAFGNGLEDLLRQRSETVLGIVNGVDYSVWSPQADPHIPWNYGPDDVAEGKAECKRFLLEQLGLPAAPAAPLLGVVSRLTAQKGFEITFDALTQALRFLDIRLAVLGSGERSLEERFQWLHRTFPEKVCFYRGYSDELAHLIEAGADIFLMPSLFEPCGLNQMYSLKYGTVPIVRRTGGLADTVELFRPKRAPSSEGKKSSPKVPSAKGRSTKGRSTKGRSTKGRSTEGPSIEGTGVVFDSYDSTGFAWALKAALNLYRDPAIWAQLRANGMAKDYSWERQGARYEALYRALLEEEL